MRKFNTIALIIVLVVSAGAIARITAHKAALKYGVTLRNAFYTMSLTSFADPELLRELLASPAMTEPLSRVQALTFLGGKYDIKADELRRGVIYLSEQMSLSPERRFSSPPALHYLYLPLNDRTDKGVAAAAMTLISSYETRL